MRPTPILNGEVWSGAERRVLAAPGGDLLDPDIALLEVLIDQPDGPGTACRYASRWVASTEEQIALREGGAVWLLQDGSSPPVALTVRTADGREL